MDREPRTRSRKEYIKEQKALGRRLFGVFPAYYPREILLAMDILPVEIWDPPVEVSHAGAHLQSYICSVVTLGLELILQGKCDEIDGFLFPHTCDSIQNLASIINDYLGLEKPCYFFYHPKAPYKASSKWFYKQSVEDLALNLGKRFGPLKLDYLRAMIDKCGQVRAGLFELYRKRSGGNLELKNEEFYKNLRLGEYLHPDDFLNVLKLMASKVTDKKRSGPSVVLSGVIPNPPEILRHLDRLGVRVADDDFLCCGRRLIAPSCGLEDPFEALTEIYFSMQPCSTKGSSISDRLNSLAEKAIASGSKGVIFQMVKFCEPELFDVPLLVSGLKEKGLHALVIDTELNQGLSGQIATRLEAFTEMLG